MYIIMIMVKIARNTALVVHQIHIKSSYTFVRWYTDSESVLSIDRISRTELPLLQQHSCPLENIRVGLFYSEVNGSNKNKTLIKKN